jgi:hypothetical protein
MRERGREREVERERERGEAISLLMFVLNPNIQQPLHMNFTSNHQNTRMSELLIQQTLFTYFISEFL